jgi:hypothetical protein
VGHHGAGPCGGALAPHVAWEGSIRALSSGTILLPVDPHPAMAPVGSPPRANARSRRGHTTSVVASSSNQNHRPRGRSSPCGTAISSSWRRPGGMCGEVDGSGNGMGKKMGAP